MEIEQSACYNEKSDEEIAIEDEEIKEIKKQRNREYQRAWRQRNKGLKKKDSKQEKRNDLQIERKEKNKERNREYQRAWRQRQKELKKMKKDSKEEKEEEKRNYLQMNRRRLDSNEDQENVVQCRASQNLQNVKIEHQFLTQQLHIYKESHECTTPKVILHRTTDIPDDGNCLFHSLIRVLQLQISTCDLRRQLRDSPYLDSCHNPQGAYNILSSNDEYGDLDCLYLFAKIYNQNVCVHFQYFDVISNEETRFCHFKANDTHDWIHLDLRELHFTPYLTDDEKKIEDERKQKEKNKEYCKRYRDKKRTSNLQTGPSARDVLVLDVQLDDLQMKRRKLDSNEDKDNVVQCIRSGLGNMDLDLNKFRNKYICKDHFPPFMIEFGPRGKPRLAKNAVPMDYLRKHDPSNEAGASTEQDNLMVRKPAKVYSKKKTDNIKTFTKNKGKTRSYDKVNTETNPNTDILQTMDIVIEPTDSDLYIKETLNEREVGVSKIAKRQTFSIPENNPDNINVIKEFEVEIDLNVDRNGAKAQEFGKIIKLEAPTDLIIKYEPPDVVDTELENECSEPFTPEVELSNPSNSNLNFNLGANDATQNTTIKKEPIDVRDIIHSEVDEDLGKYKLQENETKEDTPTREKIQLFEEVLIKTEYVPDNDIDTSMTHKQTNVTGDVANIKKEWMECSDTEVECNDPEVECNGPEFECNDTEVECNDPEVECSSESIESTSGTLNTERQAFELKNDVNDPTKWYVVLQDEQEPPPKRPKSPNRDLRTAVTEERDPLYCPTCGDKYYFVTNLRKHMLESHSSKPFKCDLCNMRFKYDFSLAAHMKQHITAYNHTMADQPDESNDLADLPLPSRSNVLTEAQDTAASTSATPFAEPPTLAAPKSKAQKQREYRQRIAASRTAAQAMVTKKLDAERKRHYRQRKAANSAFVSGSLESTTTSFSRSGARSNDVQTATERQIAHHGEPMYFTDLPLTSRSNVASTSATPFAVPLTIAAPKSKAQTQREYRQRLAESRTLAQLIASRKSDAERHRKFRLRKATNSALVSGSLESTNASSFGLRARSNDGQTGTQRELTQHDEPMDLKDLPLPSKSNVLREAQNAAASTSAAPFAESPKIAARKSKAQRQREYRQRLAASRTLAQLIAERKAAAERKRKFRLRRAAKSALVSGSLESTTASSSGSRTRSNDVQTATQRELTHHDEPMDLKDLPLPSKTNVLTEAQGAASSTSATPFAEPSTNGAPKSKAQKQREYRERLAASRTAAQAIAARKAEAERHRNRRLRKAAKSALNGSLESTTTNAAASTSATPFAEPPTISAPKSRAEKQREYRERIAASRTLAEVIAAREAAAERKRKSRLRKAANGPHRWRQH